MATVYLASASSAIGRHQIVALKVIHPHLASDHDFVEMFVDEAEIASRIHHPNVCTVYDFDTTRGQQYIAMEYLVGESLKSVYRRIARSQDLDADRLMRNVTHALAQACEGLHAAHELTDAEGDPLNVVHRDVSPENVFVTYDGITKVVDFGVASARHKVHRTSTGVIKGKVGYIAPEIAHGLRPDRRTDVWGIGVIAWELLTGQRLFHRETDIETLRAVLTAPIVPPSQVRAGLSPEVDAVVLRALSRDPSERQATARELGLQLAQLAAHGERPIGLSDLAEWLEQLFPGGRARHEQIMDVAAQLDAEADPTSGNDTPAPPSRPPGPPTPPRLDDEEIATRIHEGHAPPPSSLPPSVTPTPAPSGRAVGPVWVAALVFGAGVGLGLVAAELVRRPSASAAAPIVEAPGTQASPVVACAPGPSTDATPTVGAVVASGSPNEIVIRLRLDPPMPSTERVTAPRGARRSMFVTASDGSDSALDEQLPRVSVTSSDRL